VESIAVYSDSAIGEKKYVLKALAEGAEKFFPYKCNIMWVEGRQHVSADLAVIFGYWLPYGTNTGKSQFRLAIAEMTEKERGKIMFIDSDPLKGMTHGEDPLDRAKAHYRLPLNSIYHDEAEFYNKNSPPDRWQELIKRRGLIIKPYRKKGSQKKYIVLFTQKNNNESWSMRGKDYLKWANEAIADIRKYSKREIVIRSHPKVSINRDMFSDPINKFRTVKAQSESMEETMRNAWAAVAYSSSAAIGAVINGIPVFACSPSNPAWWVADHNLKYIEDPQQYGTTQWFNDLAYSMWTMEEMANGTFWAHFMRGYKNG
tara:strand:- start:2590 stop:3537 length:948 start_codon:yes stop_codon:yes gene_type:complete